MTLEDVYDEDGKPTLRGVLHQWGALFALVAGVGMVWSAPTGRTALCAAAFASTMVTLLVVSATYHRFEWVPPALGLMRRLDHAAIFLFLAGTYTPVALLGLPAEVGPRVLLMACGVASVGIAVELFWPKPPKVFTALCAAAGGWLIVPYVQEVKHSFGDLGCALMIAGGVSYTLGGVAYTLKRPNPRPNVFGYHEVFHLLVILGAALHFIAILRLIRATGV